jgi:hypothetical protein
MMAFRPATHGNHLPEEPLFVTRPVEYFFSVGSPWSCIVLHALLDLSRENDVEIKPLL